MKAYKVTYHIHNGWQFNDPKSTSPCEEILLAEDKDDAFLKATDRAATPGLIAHDEVSVNKKDIVPIKGALGDITVLMMDFGFVEIGTPILGESTLVRLNNGKDFNVSFVKQEYGHIAIQGYGEDDKEQTVSIDEIDQADLKEILWSLENVIGNQARDYSRQAALLEDLISETSPNIGHISSDVLGLGGEYADVEATLLKQGSGNAVLLHWPLYGDYTRAMLIPETEFDDHDRVIEAIEAFCNA